MKKVFLGAGHGGSDPGATAGGIKEKDVNLEITLIVGRELSRHGVEVKYSRTGDDNEKLNDKIDECNAFSPDLALDIHNNAGGGDGAEVYHHFGGGVGKTLAENILKEMVKAGQNSRGAKTRKNSAGRDYFAFIRETACPAVIVECAFLDNEKDVALISTSGGRKNIATAICKGILATLGIAFVEEPTKSEVLYRVQVGAYKEKENAIKMQERLKAAGFDAIIKQGE
ncbi:MAG: N-acetylmuramoyl-L-alanine amidase [Clostridia bacterium]|nr:N-acetylmuramoyl-L-alanine amidase [Clostridia bacterium]